MSRYRIPGPDEAKIRLETTSPAAAEAILAALRTHFGEAAVDLDTTRDRSAPRRGRPAVPGLAHHYLTITVPPDPRQ